MGTLASKGGVLAEPAGAAAWAGLERAVAQGMVGRNERVVVLVTGTAMKNLGGVRPERTAITINAELSDVEPHVT